MRTVVLTVNSESIVVPYALQRVRHPEEVKWRAFARRKERNDSSFQSGAQTSGGYGRATPERDELAKRFSRNVKHFSQALHLVAL